MWSYVLFTYSDEFNEYRKQRRTKLDAEGHVYGLYYILLLSTPEGAVLLVLSGAV